MGLITWLCSSPLTTVALPDKIEVKDWDTFQANYDTYLSETTAVLYQLIPTGFTPDLTLLDAVVTSLRVEPDSALFGPLCQSLKRETNAE
jgi:hypothetical protein